MLKHFLGVHFALTIFLMVLIFGPLGFSQVDLAEQAYAIFEQSCLNCHGEHGSFTEEIIINHTSLIETGAVVPGKPLESELYRRLFAKDLAKRMPLGQPQLPATSILTIGNWIQAGAPDWADTSETPGAFITPQQILETVEKHVNSLTPFDRPFARYFTTTYLYNAGESRESLNAYQRALSKLVNSLSWGREVIRPKPIDAVETIFYIDLRDYEWEIGRNRWTLIENEYPYALEFNAPTQTVLRNKLANLRQKLDCEVPFVHVDWFLATASLPPLYHNILDLPLTDRALETRLEVNVVENIRNAAGRRVWRAGFNESGVSNHNRVVERHTSRYGAYWKSYDFAGSVGTQDIFRHPLSFEHDGGEIIFNLPNGLQAYYLADAGGNRLDAAPISIVSNPAASDPTVRNGLSCIGCHTKGMKTFEDQVRASIQQKANPPFDKDRALRLYVEKATMDALVDEDTNRYRQALEKTGGVFGGIEPTQRFHEVFQGPVDTAHAAAAIGLQPQVLVRKIRDNTRLQNLLGSLVVENGNVKRDTWTQEFRQIVFALDFPEKSVATPVDQQTERIPGAAVYIPDPNLRAAIAESLGKGDTPDILMTATEMATLIELVANNRGIENLTGLEYAVNLEILYAHDNQIADLSPLSELTHLVVLHLWHNPIESLSAIEGLSNLEEITLVGDGGISDLSPLAGLVKLNRFLSWGNPISDLSPLSGLTQLEHLDICGSEASDLSPLAKLTGLKELYLAQNRISDVSPLSGLTNLTRLSLKENKISDVAALAALKQLKLLELHHNSISDFSPLANLPETTTISRAFNPGSPRGGRKIEGPWLWVTVPGERLDTHTDLLAEASDGSLTEEQVATHGIIQGTPVGDNRWTHGKIAPFGETNILEMLDEIGSQANKGNKNHIIYGSVILDSPRQQHTHMFFGCGDGVKIWLNGGLVYQSLLWRRAGNYHDFFPVNLKQGPNVLLVVIDDRRGFGWSGFFGFQEGTAYTVSTASTKTRLGYVFSKPEIHVDDTFTLNLTAEEVDDLAGWQFDITFDPTRLEAIEVGEGDFLKTNNAPTLFKKGSINNRMGKITGLSCVRLSGDGVNDAGTLVSVRYLAKAAGESRLTLDNFQLGSIAGSTIPTGPLEISISIEGELAIGDVDRDGQVTILDLILVSKHLGETSPANPAVDVNGDGIVTILDLIAVSQNLGKSSNAASPQAVADVSQLDSVRVQTWIQQAEIQNDGTLAFQRGVNNLKQILALLIPDETILLANYPNPFNPETWIPYHLARENNVEIIIYDVRGAVVRQLDFGHQIAGYYTSRSRAAYWDGRNAVGELVASGVYYYTITAGDFTATRKMLIRK